VAGPPAFGVNIGVINVRPIRSEDPERNRSGAFCEG